MKVIALLKSIPNVKIQAREGTFKSEFIPNAETKQSIEDASTGRGCKTYRNSSEMFKSLGITGLNRGNLENLVKE